MIETKERSKFKLKNILIGMVISSTLMILFFLITGSHKEIISEKDSGVKVFTHKAPQEFASKFSDEKDLEYAKGFADGQEFGINQGKKEVETKVVLQSLVTGITRGIINKITGLELAAIDHLENKYIVKTLVKKPEQIIREIKNND